MATETARNLNESTATPAGSEAVLLILVAASFSHLLNDTIQSLIPAIYPVLKDSFQLSFAQIGLITLTFQVTASLLQPLVGLYTDHRPQLFSLAIGNLYSDRNNLVISIPCHPGLRPRIGSW
jgi:FSR family fosmidomycin resistance protein-like MFS transporter